MRRIVFTIVALLVIGGMIGTGIMPTAAQAPATPSQARRSTLAAAPLLVENFDYGSSAGNLTAVSSWTAHSGAGSGPVQYVPTSLEMPGYGSSGVGGAATISTAGSEDVSRDFGVQNAGTIYFAALVNVSAAGTGDYFLHLKDSGTNFRARVFVQNDGGILRYGLGTTGAATYATANFNYNTTYLVVAKYNVSTGDTALYVLDAATPVEPATPLVALAGAGSFSIQAIAIRQGAVGQRPAATIDGIRVAHTWEDVIGYTSSTAGFTIRKFAPALVDTDAEFTYTLVARNLTGGLRSGVVITDSLPTGVAIGAISDGGSAVGNVVRWDVATLDHGAAVTRTVQVTAPSAATTLVNSDYGVWASDWLTRAIGSAVQTMVRLPVQPLMSIYDLQYTTIPGPDNYYPSLYVGQIVTTTGTVCAHLSRGYIIAEAPGPWRSLYIYNGNNAKPALGAEYLVRGTLLEYYGMTEFSYPGQRYIDQGPDVCAPTILTAAQIPFNNPAISEPYESVIVELHNITITSVTTNRAFFTDSSGGTGAIGKEGYFPPDIAVGQQYVYVRGPVIYTYDEYRIMPPTAADIKLLDIVPPTVTTTIPTNGATDVSPHRPLYATFSESVDPSTVNAASFTLTGPGGPVTGTVAYNAATRQAIFTPHMALAANSLHTAALTAEIKDLAENPLVPYSWTFTTGPLDETPPTIVASIPTPGAVDFPLGADLVITFSESLKPHTVVGANFTLTGPYGATPWDSVTYNDAEQRLTLNPRGLLLPQTVYTLTIAEAVVDWGDNPIPPAQRSWSFTTEVEPPMNVYHGDLHNHTSYSDGAGTPAQAFTQARAAGLDFLAISDHCYAVDDTEWADTLAQANAHTVDGEFVAIRGFEYTQGAEGHINVYNTVRRATRSNVTGCTTCDYTPNLEAGVTVQGFYPWLANPDLQAVDDAGIIMMFNHPGWMNFNDWTYHPEVEHLAQLEEVGNGTGTSYVFSFDEWIRSLDYGWKVGATNNSDTHRPNWGEATPHRTGIVAPELTKRALFDAMRARRTFATEDSNYEILFKANGYWMGSELPNTGEITFEISFNDPDGERTALLELYTNQGLVYTSTRPGLADGTWNFTLTDIEPGVHYFFVKATQEDGDRIVTSPVWTMGEEDVSISDLTIQPTIPTIYNPSLLTARVTNRGLNAHPLTVTFEIDGVVIGEVPVLADVCTVGPCRDAFAQISWHPSGTGPVTVRVALQGAPSADNPRDNVRTLKLNVTDEKVPLILIDGGHNNIGISPREVKSFVTDMTHHGYNVLFNLDEITASDLNTETVRLLIINAYGPQQLTADEIAAIADFVAAGGSLWLNGVADYTGKVAWADTTADRFNELLAAIEARVGHNIPMRMNDDQVADGNNNNGYKWGVRYHIFPEWQSTGVGANVQQIQTWSICSLMSRDRGPLTPEVLGPNGFLMVQGDLDPGSSSGPYYSNTLNRTHNSDEDSWGDAYIYPATIPLAGAAGYMIPGAGRIFLHGDSNDAFNTFAYVAGDGMQNELFNLQVVMWLLGNPLQKRDIAAVRTPENLHRLVWVEGVITAAYGEFFNVLYVQDETGGITVHAPAGDIYADNYLRGKRVRVVGTIGEYQGDMEIEFFEAEMVQVLGEGIIPDPRPLSTYEAGLFENQGWLVQITGTVLAKSPELDTLIVDDGSGPIRAFLDGYNGVWDNIEVLDRVTVIGLASHDGEGPRIRVRHYQSDDRPDDASVLAPQADLRYSAKTVSARSVHPGDLLTYTLHFFNSGNLTATVQYADTLPPVLTLVSGALEGEVEVGPWEIVHIEIVARVKLNASVGTTFANTVLLDDGTQLLSFTSPETVVGEVLAPDLSGSHKTVSHTSAAPGDLITYTIILSNSGNIAASVRYTDTLPAEVTLVSGALSGEVNVNSGATQQVVIVVRVRETLTTTATITNTVTLNDGVNAPFVRTSPATEILIPSSPKYTLYLPVVFKYHP